MATHTAGPWDRKSIPGHLFEIHNGTGEIVLRIRGGMMPTLADARLMVAAPELLGAVILLRATLRAKGGPLAAERDHAVGVADDILSRAGI